MLAPGDDDCGDCRQERGDDWNFHYAGYFLQNAVSDVLLILQLKGALNTFLPYQSITATK